MARFARRTGPRLRRAVIGMGSVGTLVVLCCAPTIGGATTHNELASKTAKQVFEKGVQDTFGAHSFILAGKLRTSGQTMALHVAEGQAQGSGTITINGQRIDLALVNGTVYVEAPSSFYQSEGADQSQAQQFGGKWLTAPATDPAYSKIVNFLTPTGLQASFLTTFQSKENIRYTKAGSGEVNGTAVMRVSVVDPKDASNNVVVSVTTTGTPYLVRLRGTGTAKGQITFSGFNRPLAVAVPPNAIPAPNAS